MRGVLRRRLLPAVAAALVPLAGSMLSACAAPQSVGDKNWQQDIAYLARKLPLVHVDGLTHTSRAAWAAAAAHLQAQVPRLSNGQVIVAMTRLIAMLRDDETQLTMPTSPVYPFAAQWIGNTFT